MNSEILNYLQRTPGFKVYQKSFTETNNFAFAIVRKDAEEYLIVTGESYLTDKFEGEVEGAVKICPLSHKNRLAVNEIFPFTCPRAAGRESVSIGLGDRLGLANYAHLRCIENKKVFPVIAQQSKRELDLTNRTYEDVLDSAVWSVCKAGWRHGFGADGDHLKTIEDIRYALSCGFSMITLDCSDAIGSVPDTRNKLTDAYEKIPAVERWRMEAVYLPYEDSYRLGISYTPDSLMEIAVCYYQCILLAEKVYFEEIVKTGRTIDLEISLDETQLATSPEAHFFVANELRSRGVVITSLAPKFVGEFQKAVDYKGNLYDFERHYASHCRIADHFGHKSSIHSGSDKFSIFPIVGEHSNKRMHLKTSGTSWLEAVRVISMYEPDLYRRMHRNALKHLDVARKYYDVHADITKIPPLDETPDELLPEYLNHDDSRQLLHITYGYQLSDPEIRRGLFDALNRYYCEYINILGAHIEKHISLLKIADRD